MESFRSRYCLLLRHCSKKRKERNKNIANSTLAAKQSVYEYKNHAKEYDFFFCYFKFDLLYS